MEISKGRKKSSKKFYKKTTKVLKCVQKHTIPSNHNSGTEKLVHESIHISNLQTEKYPANYQAHPDSCKYYVVKRRFTVKQRKWGKNGVYMSHSHEHARRCKQTHINRFFIAPSSYALQMVASNKILKKKCTSEKINKSYDPYSNSAPVISNKSFDTESFRPKISTKQSKENVCIVNNQFNCENALLLTCSTDSLQLQRSKISKKNKKNSNENFISKQINVNMKKRENYNNINDILPNLMQQVTVYRILENMKRGNNSEDNIYSSVSTCSSSSSTREYYLPAVSSSTDTMHVANVLVNRRLVDLPNPQKEIISTQQNGNHGIIISSYNKNNSNLSPVFQQAPLENEILSSNNIETKEDELELKKSNNQQIIEMLKDNNVELMPFLPFTRFNSLVGKNRSRVIKNCEQSSIGVQTQKDKIYENDEDDSTVFKPIKNKRIKLSKENFIVNNNTKNNEFLDITTEKNKQKHLNSLPFVATTNYKKMTNNFNEARKELTKILSEHLCDTQADRKENISLDCNSNSNISLSRPKNKSISEDVIFTVKNKSNITHTIRSGIEKPKSSLCISNMKSESAELPLYYKSHPNASDDSLNTPKPRFVKLNPFFDEGFKDPKISRLILSSRTLAGESDSTIPHIKIITPDFTDTKSKTFNEGSSKENYQKPVTITEIATIPSIEKNLTNLEENKLVLEHSNRSIFSADSIIYGSNAFQKIREKFDLIKNKMKIIKGNKMFQEKELNKQRVSTPQPLLEKKLESENNGKDNSKANNNKNINAPQKSFMNLMYENKKKVSSISLENQEFSDKRKYLLLLPKKLNLSNSQSQHSYQELSYINDKKQKYSSSTSFGKSVEVNTMEDEHKLIDINLKRCNSKKEVKATICENEITKSEKETIDTKSSLEKQTQVNMYSVEDFEKSAADIILNEIPFTKKHEISTIEDSKVAQTVMLDNNSHEEGILINENSQVEAESLNNNFQTKTTISNNSVHGDVKILNNGVQANATTSNNNVQVEATVSNNDAQAEATTSKNNGQAEGTMLNNYGQPVILYNSSGYPITDLNGRVLKNNLGAYLLNSNKYEDVITKQLPVFDCDLMSVSSACFNPTKVPFVKIQLKITDRCGNPVSLFNNLGWPLTNKDGFFLHDNLGKLLVEMDSFNFPLCCSNGSPVYLQNGAMLLSQKFKFVVTKPEAESNAIKPLKIGRRYENVVVDNCNMKVNKINSVKAIECCNTIKPLNESNSKDFKRSKFLKPKKRIPNFKNNFFFPTEVPELMHEFFDNKARPRFSDSRNQGSIPQSPIPIFDRAGNRLTDENGFPLKNKYGEYMLLLDKNGIALSDSCGGPIFDSNGKQLWLKDLYHMKKHPSLYYLYDRYMPPEHPYIDTSNSDSQNTHDSSDDLVPLLDLNFEIEQSSEPIMNYIKENNINTYDSAGQQIHFIQNRCCRTRRKPIKTNFLKNVSATRNEHYVQPSMTAIKENVLFYETSGYQEETGYKNLYDSLNQQIDESNIPCSYEQSIYEDSVLNQQQPQVNSFEQYDNYYYDARRFPENSQFHQDAEIQYYVDDNNYVMYY